MGFYLRRSFRLGPLRFNFSKRGVGASVGVKGLRAGVDAKGKGYVAGGRGGLYFRERIPSPQPSEAGRAPDTGSRLPGIVAIAVVGLVVLIVLLVIGAL